MKMIERGLAEVHSDLLGSNGEGPSVNVPSSSNGNSHMNGVNGASSGDTVNGTADEGQAFAVVGCVHNGSPADVAVRFVCNFTI